MTEFAYSGVGLNPHYGTPRSPCDRETGLIPGGSSSGAGVPTTCNAPPAISALARDEDYLQLNFMSLRNTFTGNFLDCCGISLPMHRKGELPTGLMLMAPHGQDQQMFAIAKVVEGMLASLRN